MMYKKTIQYIFVLLLGVSGLTSQAFAHHDPNDLFNMSIEDLMDIPLVISASRAEGEIGRLSVPVSVITADDIHYSGLTSIPEILQFAPGVDVTPLSRIHYAVGVRGLHDFVADRTLTLINGRTADSPYFGGSEFYRYPILMEDIERIEIVRGPGGAAWGANAFTGVINIITKQPGQDPGWLLSSTVNEYGDIYNHIRFSGQRGRWSWRSSVGYEDFEDSDAAGAGKMSLSTPALNALIGFDSYAAQDYARNFRTDNEFRYEISDETIFSFGAGYSHLERGDIEFIGYFPGGHARYETFRSFAKIEHFFDDETSGYLQWSGNYNNSMQPSMMKWKTFENDIELQFNKQINDHHISVGGNVRFTHIHTHEISPESLTGEGGPFDERTMGIFFIDRFDVTEKLKLETQIRSDWYSETEHDWSTRLTALYALDDAQNHNVRLSFARAFRTPFLGLRNSQASRIYHPGLMTYLYRINNTRDLDHEETWSVEAGYAWHLNENTLFQANAYFQQFDRLIAYERTETPPIVSFSADNINGADTWGVETELSFRNQTGQLALWYAYNDFQENEPHQLIRSYLPAQHKVGITGRLFLDQGLCLNANYRYATTTDIVGDTSYFPVDPAHRLDLTVSKDLANGRGQFMVGVTDLLNETRGPNYIAGTFTAHEIPGRTFFTRLQLKF